MNEYLLISGVFFLGGGWVGISSFLRLFQVQIKTSINSVDTSWVCKYRFKTILRDRCWIYLNVSTRLPSHRTLPCCETAPDPMFSRPPNIAVGTSFWLALPPCRHTAISSPIRPWFPVVYKYYLTWTCRHLPGNRNFMDLSYRLQSLGEKSREVAIDLPAASFSEIRRKHVDETTDCRQIGDRCADQYLYNYHSS